MHDRSPLHSFHIPVLGTGFTIETPLRVARYGISSVLSLVDDDLIEQTRHKVAATLGIMAERIGPKEPDHRARRITAYLNLVDEVVREQIEHVRQAAFEKGSEITRYFEMLPASPLRDLYERMRHTDDDEEIERLQRRLREEVRPGSIDVNIMTKVDRDPTTGRIGSGALNSAAMASLRGFAKSTLESSVVLSAGMNLRLFTYLSEFDDFFPDAAGHLRKKIILKVGDLRSALIQGKVLAKRGLWISEFRIESGLNCGGHAFGGSGRVLGPILEEFQAGRAKMVEQLHSMMTTALRTAGRACPDAPLPSRLTVQGGIGTAEEDAMLRETYGVDGTGWGSPFLLVPEAVNIDAEHLPRLVSAREEDVVLSRNSPLGIPFWNLRTSESERQRRAQIAEGRPGSACPKGFLISDTEFHEKGLCTASRPYQKQKLAEIEALEGVDAKEREDLREGVLSKACLCRDLTGSAVENDARGNRIPTAICCGPNTVYFSAVARLKDMVDHIYGRISLPLAADRPHVFLKELQLHVERLREEANRKREGLQALATDSLDDCRKNLEEAIAHYRAKVTEIAGERTDEFLEQLERLQAELAEVGGRVAVQSR